MTAPGVDGAIASRPGGGGVPWGWHDKAPTPKLPALLRHAALYVADVGIARDADALLDAAGNDRDREAMRQYIRLRRQAPGFAPEHRERAGHYDHNNHDQIPAAALAALTEAPRAVRACLTCGKSFRYHRATARYCSATCRQRGRRNLRATDLAKVPA